MTCIRTHTRLPLCLLALLCLTWATTRAADKKARELAKNLSTAFSDIAEEVSPAVVAIHAVRTEKANPFGGPGMEDLLRKFFEKNPELKKQLPPESAPRPRRHTGMGSGFIIDAQGHVVTNNHVVEGTESLKVVLKDESEYEAEIVGTDPKTDLAVIKIKNPPTNLPQLVLGDSKALKPGHLVVAIGAPFGLTQTVTVGIVSATGRNRLAGGQLGAVMYQDFIQTDATINPGNSGGPLVDLDGRVIGINSAIATRTGVSNGVGFAIPVHLAKEIIKPLIEEGEVTRGWLGVTIEDVTPEMAASLPNVDGGVAIGDVRGGSPAAKSGVQAGDIFLVYAGKPLANAAHLQRLVARTPVGKAVPVEIVRQGEKMTLRITIGKQPDDPFAPDFPGPEQPEPTVESTASKILGVEVQSFGEEIAQEFPEHQGHEGVLVTRVVPDGPADQAGIREGALIVQVDQKNVPTLSKFNEVVKTLEGRKKVLLLVRQEGGARFLVLNLDGE